MPLRGALQSLHRQSLCDAEACLTLPEPGQHSGPPLSSACATQRHIASGHTVQGAGPARFEPCLRRKYIPPASPALPPEGSPGARSVDTRPTFGNESLSGVATRPSFPKKKQKKLTRCASRAPPPQKPLLHSPFPEISSFATTARRRPGARSVDTRPTFAHESLSGVETRVFFPQEKQKKLTRCKPHGRTVQKTLLHSPFPEILSFATTARRRPGARSVDTRPTFGNESLSGVATRPSFPKKKQKKLTRCASRAPPPQKPLLHSPFPEISSFVPVFRRRRKTGGLRERVRQDTLTLRMQPQRGMPGLSACEERAKQRVEGVPLRAPTFGPAG